VRFLRTEVRWPERGREHVVAYIQDEYDDQPVPVQIRGALFTGTEWTLDIDDLTRP